MIPTFFVTLFWVTFLLAAAAAAAELLRRQSAATRHFVWVLALGGALAMPLLVGVAPQLTLPIPLPTSSDRTALLDRWGTSGPASSAARFVASQSAVTDRIATFVEESTPSRVAVSPARWLLILWLAGGAVVLARIVIGHVVVAHLTRRAIPLGGQDWVSLLADARRHQGVLATVRLYGSDSIGAPITWGMAAPVIVFPAEVDAWPVERRRAALEHELAHIARRDYWTQLGAALACGVYWFHPLVWLAARHLRAESEHACDDRVVTAGTRASDYAAHLLEVARGAYERRFTDSVAVCMAGTSHLETRMRALLDEARSRRPWPQWAGAAAALALGLVLIPIAGLRPALRTARAASASESNLATTTPEPDSIIDKTVNASPGQELILDLKTGGEVHIRGWDEERVEMHAELSGEDWRNTRVEIETEAGGVRVTSRQRRRPAWTSSTSHRFEFRVPKRFDVQVKSSGGNLELTGVEGTFRGSTGGGEIVLTEIKGEVGLSTGGGDVRVTDSQASGKVTTGGGMVQMNRVQGGLRGTSGSGPVLHSESSDGYGDLDGVHADEDDVRDERTGAAGALYIEKAGGDVSLPNAPHGAHIQTGGGDIQVRAGKGWVQASTGGGDIEIGPIAGSVTATTGAGEVRVTLGDAKGEKQDVEISAGIGRVVVLLPSGFEGHFDLETAYTDNYERPTRIDSEWKLERDETTNWDSYQGTPRRYVRARGMVGKSDNTVRVRTVNGDIIVKRSAGTR